MKHKKLATGFDNNPADFVQEHWLLWGCTQGSNPGQFHVVSSGLPRFKNKLEYICVYPTVSQEQVHTYTVFIEGTVVNVQGLNILVGATFSD